MSTDGGKTRQPRPAKAAVDKAKLTIIKLKDLVLADIDAKVSSALHAPAHTDAWYEEIYKFVEEHEVWFEDSLEKIEEIKESKELDKIKSGNKAAYDGLVKGYTAQKNIIDEAITKHKESLPEGEKISIATYDSLLKQYRSIEKMIDVDLKKIANDIMEIPANNKVDHHELYHKERLELSNKYQGLIAMATARLENVISSTPNHSIIEHNVNSSNVSTASQSRPVYNYAKSPLPRFTGLVRYFPAWVAEWEEVIAPAYPDVVLIRMLNENCPMDLLHCTSKAEAFKLLRNKYASPALVSATLINDFLKYSPDKSESKEVQIIDIHYTFDALYKDLKAVSQEQQLTGNHHLLRRAIEHFPDVYSVELVKELTENDQKSDEAKKELFNIIYDYLTFKKDGLEAHAAWCGIDLVPKKKKKENKGEKKQCSTCGKFHHGRCRFDRTGGGGGAGVHSVSTQDSEAKLREIQSKWGPCPKCNARGHTYTVNGSPEKKPSSRLNDCDAFMKLSKKDKVDFLQSKNLCSLCLSWRHDKAGCQARIKTCRFKKPDGSFCGGQHHRLFHDFQHAFLNAVRVSAADLSDDSEQDDDIPPLVLGSVGDPIPDPEISAGSCRHDEPLPVFLPMQEVELAGCRTTLFWDQGANCSLVTNKFAKRIGLKGYKKRMMITLASKAPEEVETMVYPMRLTSNSGQFADLKLIGVDRITSRPQQVSVQKAYDLFPHLPPGSVDRPTLEVGILVGQDGNIVHPVGGEEHAGERVGNLRCLRSGFGTGFLLTGSHDDIPAHAVNHVDSTEIYRTACAITVLPVDVSISAARVSVLPACYEEDDLGVRLPPNCPRCSNCHKCNSFRTGLTREEQEIVNVVDSGLHLDTETCTITCRYPVNDKINLLKNNYHQAVKRQESLERSLMRKGALDQYNRNFDDVVQRGAIVKISREDLRRYEAMGHPVHFIGHHAVWKESHSTPCRMVADCSLRNNWTGPSLNDCCPRPPNSLNDLYNVLLRWRSYECSCIFDLSKAYNVIRTTDFEKYLRLQVWRHGDTSKDWDVYGYATVAFGDVAASLCLELAKNRVADRGLELGMDPMAVEKLKQDVYVDDYVGGGSRADVDRMVGTCQEVDGKLVYDGTFAQILSLGGFRAKSYLTSGVDNHPRALETLSPVLGHVWSPEEDWIYFDHLNKVKVKKDGRETLLTEDMVDDLQITKRTALSILSGQYDPTGLLSPLWIRMKIHMREIVMAKFDWDDVLPEAMQRTWRNFARQLINFPRIGFPRSVRPPQPTGRPELVVTWDGSSYAYSGTVHVRTPVGPDTWHVALLTAKSRVTPAGGMTTPRSELSGLVASIRTADRAMASMEVTPSRITVLGDSECTVASVEATASLLAPYFANRVSEVSEVMKRHHTHDGEGLGLRDEIPDGFEGTFVDPICHIPGTENISDLSTRPDATIEDIKPGSDWQDGSPWMRLPRSQWPISRDFVKTVPENERRSKIFKIVNHMEAEPVPGANLSNILHYSDRLEVVRGVMSRAIRAWRSRDNLSISLPLTAEDYDEGDRWLLWFSMFQTKQMEKAGHLDSLAVFWEDGICYTRGRIDSESMERILGKSQLPVLSPKSRLAELYMIYSHREDHRRSPNDCNWRSRRFAWIVSSNDLARRVTSSCARCKVTHRRHQTQRIADLPRELFEAPVQVYSNVLLDHCGPFLVSSPTRKRTKMKTWVLLVSCLNSGNLNALLCADYSTESFLTQLTIHACTYRWPRVVYSDQAANLLAGKKSMEGEVNWSELEEKTARHGVSWRVNPSYSQWRTGRVERAVASLKKTMDHFNYSVNLSYVELQLLLAKSVRVINLRPLGVRCHNNATPDFVPITPYNLMFGSEADPGDHDKLDLETIGSLVRRLRMVDEIHKQWWAKWYRDVFTGLLPLPRWKSRSKNLQKDDICLLGFSNKFAPGTYRLCRVTQTFPDSMGMVRDVEVVIRPTKTNEASLPYVPRELTSMKVSVQRLILISPVEEQNEAATEPEPQKPASITVEAAPSVSETIGHVNVQLMNHLLSDNVSVPSDELAAPLLLHAVSVGDAPDRGGEDALGDGYGFSLSSTLPHACGSWCPGDLELLDQLEIGEIDGSASWLPDDLAFDSQDAPFLAEGDHNNVLGHDEDAFGV